ncbi:MAG: ectoine hydrolase DoeA, partial [Rhodospirillaceae bacterium]|nr:ectoine hydrolase DoeA [Rhodospirillaceae bacterium]
MVDFDKPFGPAEYAERIAKARKRMAAADIDLLVSVDPANICWLTGYDSWSFYTPQAVLLHVEEGGPVWWGRPMDEPAAHITTDLPPEDIVMYSDTLVHRPDVHAFDDLCLLVKARGWDKGRIAV